VALTVAFHPGAGGAGADAVAAALKRADPDASFTFRTFDELLRATVTQERIVALLSAFFGGLALLLAGVGVYGVMSQFVNRRRAEIGIRMALGAPASGVLALVFRRAGGLIAAGIVAGAALSWWAARYVESMLFGLDARDPLAFAAAAGVLLAAGLVAAWLPARRAARLDPAAVLRE
jgi:ABC-type antimicrobial peptide transport system permease subunit